MYLYFYEYKTGFLEYMSLKSVLPINFPLFHLSLTTFCTVIFFKLIYTLDIILRNECMFWHLQILHHVKKNPILFGPFSISISVYFICTKAHPFCSVLCLPQFCQCDIFEMETCVIKFLMLTYKNGVQILLLYPRNEVAGGPSVS